MAKLRDIEPEVLLAIYEDRQVLKAIERLEVENGNKK